MSNSGSNTGKTLVAIATYNEIENLPPLADEIFRYLPAADLLVVDDNSPTARAGGAMPARPKIPACTACIVLASWAWERRSSRR